MTELLPECRVIVEEVPRSGAWNMGLDEALLESAIASGQCTLRWYRWEEATASLGYFQGHAELSENPAVAALPVVRRLSGGGTIVHEHEWTYCLVLPPGQRIIQQPHELYGLVHGEVVASLRGRGYDVQLRGATLKAAPEPVLCFSRQDAHDVVCGGRKVLGSAQRRRKGALLQHGSLVLRAPSTSPEHPGLEELCPAAAPISTAEIVEMAGAVSERIALRRIKDGWERHELELGSRLADEQPCRVVER